MILETLVSALLGLGLAWGVTLRLAHRLPSRRLVLGTGVVGALFGAFITHSALGDGHLFPTLAGAVVLSLALLSLLIRPVGRVHRSATV
ncbi:hypothetical protein DSC45_16305 [Streptomyces sp. YIM 130001]|uniref:hypothetical protein n=1 Tax=Streptomyces sp. YIM 130001 TaxID=2259644 RepID=UPI000E65BF25|nr:hypothetical protein [Streptomyces sp. YIM 130001]RII16150.1 hypothetical protein DSC45_16305 [Streptomyces sp. YIM 130001]